MGEIRDEAARDLVPPAPPRWRGIQSLDLVQQLNERCLEMLCEVAVTATPPFPLPIVAEHRGLWAGLDRETRRSMARIPFVIVDAHFMDEPWWRQVTACTPVEASARQPSDGLPPEASEHLMHETTMFAWQTARWDRTAAQLSLGMSRPVADVIAALAPRQIRMIAAQESSGVRVRWADDPQFWTDLLVAAKDRDDGRVAELHLHAKLLMCGELAQLRN